MGSREDGLKTDAVAAAFPKILSSLIGDSLSHRHGADPSGLERGGQFDQQERHRQADSWSVYSSYSSEQTHSVQNLLTRYLSTSVELISLS